MCTRTSPGANAAEDMTKFREADKSHCKISQHCLSLKGGSLIWTQPWLLLNKSAQPEIAFINNVFNVECQHLTNVQPLELGPVLGCGWFIQPKNNKKKTTFSAELSVSCAFRANDQ